MIQQKGAPLHKIVVGVPAYARKINNPGEVKTWSELVENTNAVVYEDDLVDGYVATGGLDLACRTLPFALQRAETPRVRSGATGSVALGSQIPCGTLRMPVSS